MSTCISGSPVIHAFGIFCDFICGGPTLLGLEGETPDLYPTREKAQEEIDSVNADYARQAAAGERDADDVSVDWFLGEVLFNTETGHVKVVDDGDEFTLSPECMNHLRECEPELFKMATP